MINIKLKSEIYINKYKEKFITFKSYPINNYNLNDFIYITKKYFKKNILYINGINIRGFWYEIGLNSGSQIAICKTYKESLNKAKEYLKN